VRKEGLSSSFQIALLGLIEPVGNAEMFLLQTEPQIYILPVLLLTDYLSGTDKN
jgi:hypothetical protein